MNILYDYQVFARQACGGISRYFYELIKHSIKEDDMNVSLFQGLHVNMFDMKPYAKQLDYYFGIKHKQIPKTGVVLSGINKQLFNLWLHSTRVNTDIYHPTYYNHISLCDHKNCRKVITVYDMIHAKMSRSAKEIDPTTAMMKKCVEKADKIIAISENTKRDLIEYFKIPESHIDVIYLAVNQFQDITNKEKDVICLNRPEIDKPFILYVGERAGYKGYKNFKTLLNAFAAWNKREEFYLICVGGANQWSREDSRIIRKENIQNSVKLFSDVTDDELRRFYSNAYVYVISSLYEGFGIPVLEAMACNVPVIAAKTSSIPEVVGGAGLYFSPLSVEELIMRLDMLVDDEKLRDALRIKGLQQSKLFSWKETASKTYRLYRDLSN
ncbi:MAG: glycosyltransferase family 4 protein [Kiritimatiellae bacterium]|nr:glycosyltransferase family 4 protein [Kiritimatiellia bacterium]